MAPAMEPSTSHFSLGGLPLLVAFPAGGASPVVFTGALGVKGACRCCSAGGIQLDLGPSIPALPCAIGGCSASRRVEDVTGVWEKSMVGRLLLAETAATLPVVPILMALSSTPGLVMFWMCSVVFYAW